MHFSIRPLLIGGFLAAYGAAHAWSATGHMLIASIARRDLTPYARSEADRLLKVGATDRASDFVTSGPWADDIRSARPETGNWHFINLHFRSDRKRVVNVPESENVVVTIERMRKILADRTKPDTERADALRFLIHFVGDIHQPLHAVARDSDAHPTGDRGGNDFEIQPPESMANDARPPRNLHALWDSGVGLFPFVDRPLSGIGRALIESEAATIAAAVPRETLKNAGDPRPAEWAKDGLATAKKVVYDLREGSVPSDDYVRRGQTLSVRLIALAGYRLADLLNETLK